MSKHMISTEVVAGRCGKCGVPTFTGYDDGIQAVVDQEVIGVADGELSGELAALLADKLTYTLASSHELVERTAERVLAQRPSGTIHAQHRCAV